MSATLGQIVNDLTKGRPFAFMVMPYGEKYDFFVNVKKAVEETLEMACLRADDAKTSGHDLLAKIHFLLERADIVIAEISPGSGAPAGSPNVFYEIGYAKALQKPLLLLIEHNKEVPTDLRGLEVIHHGGSRATFEQFDSELRKHLRIRLTSRSALLRDMLLADEPRPSYVVASPKYPTVHSQVPGHVRDKRTFGDNLGVLGLISAFGTMLGEHSELELISGRYNALDLQRSSVNLYLVGSEKANELVPEVLRMLLPAARPCFRFVKHPDDLQSEHYRMLLERQTPGGWRRLTSRTEPAEVPGSRIATIDHGLLLRGPHPNFPNRLLMLMAGPHSLGTGAACLAATNSRLIAQIQNKLPDDVRLSDKEKTIWVLVKGRVSRTDSHLDAAGVTILETGEIQPPRKKQTPKAKCRADDVET